MHWGEIWRRLLALWSQTKQDADLEQEMRTHIELRAMRLRSEGLDPDEALYAAKRRFGNVSLFRETSAAMWSWAWIDSLRQDLRYSARILLRNPAYTLFAVTVLALGIGADSAMFSVVNAVLFNGLPYPKLDRLVFINESLPKAAFLNVSWPDFLDWAHQNHSFESMAVIQPARVKLIGAGEPRIIPGAFVTAPFFSLMGAHAVLGRTFTAADDTLSSRPVAVVSYAFWRNSLKSDPNAVGKEIELRERAVLIAGVLSPTFRAPWECDAYMPLGLETSDPSLLSRENHPGLIVMARLLDGLSIKTARADMDAIMARLASAYPASDKNESAVVTSFAERMLGDVRTQLLVLFGAAGLVLLLACANLAHLALARAATRQREFAVRLALGAGRGALIRHSLAETAVLIFLGGFSGLLLAYGCIGPIVRLCPYNVPGLAEAKIDMHVLLFTLAISIASGLLFGLAPTLHALRTTVNLSLKQGDSSLGGGSAGRLHRWTRASLFVTEIAFALVLSIGAGLLLRSLTSVLDVSPGFRADHLLALDVVRSTGNNAGDSAFFQNSLERLQHLPGVTSATAVMCPPLGGTCWTSPYARERLAASEYDQRPWTALNMIAPNYFSTMSTPLLEGRFFVAADTANSPAVAIVNRTMAHLLSSDGHPVGRYLNVQYAAHPVLEIVGVVPDVKQFALDAPVMPEVYVPVSQMPVSFMTILLRTAIAPGSLTSAARQVIEQLDRRQPIAQITPMTESIAFSLGSRKFATFLLSLFSALAVLLAAIGVFGVMTYTVAQQTREIGIRMALGARGSQLLRRILSQSARLAAVGLVIGVGGAWALTRLLSRFLFGVTAHDPLTFLGVTFALVCIALLASLLPALRASATDPVRALRYE